jgi:hypothetical protein
MQGFVKLEKGTSSSRSWNWKSNQSGTSMSSSEVVMAENRYRLIMLQGVKWGATAPASKRNLLEVLLLARGGVFQCEICLWIICICISLLYIFCRY